jgi:putative aldouronate transport system substrate-binding protein
MHRGASPHSPLTPRLTRRGFLTATAGAVGVVAAQPLLAACGHAGGGNVGTTSTSELAKILPDYVPSTGVTPDIPSVNGSDPGFISYPANPVHTVTEVPGAGGTYSTITPLWASIPPANNQYYQAVNQALGATLQINPSNGNTYGTVLPTLFAGNKLPNWIQVPGWNEVNVANFGNEVQASFADLTPYLSGSNVRKYSNLAALPTGAWQAAVWNNKIYGIPVYPGTHIYPEQLFYRADILDKLGLGTPSINSAQDLYDLGKEVNDPKHGRWAFDDLWSALFQPFAFLPGPPLMWTENDKGDLVANWEMPEIIEAMNWQASTIRAGMVHPDAIALQTSSAKQRFWSGEVVIEGDGNGAWVGDDAVSGQAADKSYVRMSLYPFTASGTGTPVYYLNNSCNMFSYLNAGLSKSQIEECLRIANYLAAPFGSYEYTLVNYGVKTTDWTAAASGPQLTATGLKDVTNTFSFLATPLNVQNVEQGFVDVVKANCAWQQEAGKYAVKPLFWNMNISVPASLANAWNAATFTNATGNIIQEVVRGKSSIADYQAAVKSWQTNGGNALRTFYDGIRSKYGTA